MKFIAPLVSGFKQPFQILADRFYKPSEEFEILKNAINSIAEGDKPWLMKRVVDYGLPSTMSRREKKKLEKLCESHAKIIEARIYRQSLCQFALGEDVDLSEAASNAASLGRSQWERGEESKAKQAESLQYSKQVGKNIQQAYNAYLRMQQQSKMDLALAEQQMRKQNFNPYPYGTIK